MLRSHLSQILGKSVSFSFVNFFASLHGARLGFHALPFDDIDLILRSIACYTGSIVIGVRQGISQSV
jgi:hypothetical protein